MRKGLKKLLNIILMTCMILYLAAQRPALAVCCDCCSTGCSAAQYGIDTAYDTMEHTMTQFTVTMAFMQHELWLVWFFINDYINRALMLMTQQLVSIAMQQVMIIGTYFDADIQRETMRSFQIKANEAHQDYYVSAEMCSFGTITKALGSSEQRGIHNANHLAQNFLDRQLLNRNSISAEGRITDRRARLRQFKDSFCDPTDHDNVLDVVCTAGPVAPERKNKDIDYVETLYMPYTLDINYDDGAAPTDDEENVMALANNIYGARPLPYLTSEILKVKDNQRHILDYRAVVAKRAVAYNSYNALVAMKSPGANTVDGNPAPYMYFLLDEFQIPQDEIETMIGEFPSYYAQMDFLTKKLYQYPEFYTNLYDKPANVERKAAALNAIDSMQAMDNFDSQLRFETMLSVLLEMKVRERQLDVEDDIEAMVDR